MVGCSFLLEARTMPSFEVSVSLCSVMRVSLGVAIECCCSWKRLSFASSRSITDALGAESGAANTGEPSGMSSALGATMGVVAVISRGAPAPKE